jgi:hypothetical protein
MSSKISQNHKLCGLVMALAMELNRPVCSADLERHFEIEPENRPLLTQRLGQLLLKAALPAQTDVPRIRQVGLHGYRAYYAPDASRIWDDRFAQFRNEEELILFHRLCFFENVRYLLGGSHDALARHSLAGWIVEADYLMGRCPTHPLSTTLVQQCDQTRHLAAPSFTRVIPCDLLIRSAALSLIQSFIQERAAHRLGFKINYCRYLTDLKWPQSHLYPPLQVLKYSARQLQAFLVSRWPMDHENEEEACAVRWALRYPLG